LYSVVNLTVSSSLYDLRVSAKAFFAVSDQGLLGSSANSSLIRLVLFFNYSAMILSPTSVIIPTFIFSIFLLLLAASMILWSPFYSKHTPENRSFLIG
jgi:hypothetical protein